MGVCLVFAACFGAAMASPALAQGSEHNGVAPRPARIPFGNGGLKICKAVAHPMMAPVASFTVTPGNLAATAMPSGCSATLSLPAGTYTITEAPSVYFLVGCSAAPTGTQAACSPGNRTSTVVVHAGAVTTATITNDKQPASSVPTQ